MDLLSELTVTVEYYAHKHELPLVIVKSVLFGRNWSLKIWRKILSIIKDNRVVRLEKKYSKLLR